MADERRVYADIEKVAMEHGFDLQSFMRAELGGADEETNVEKEEKKQEEEEEEEVL